MLFSSLSFVKSNVWFLVLEENIVRSCSKEPVYFLILANILMNVKDSHLMPIYTYL